MRQPSTNLDAKIFGDCCPALKQTCYDMGEAARVVLCAGSESVYDNTCHSGASGMIKCSPNSASSVFVRSSESS